MNLINRPLKSRELREITYVCIVYVISVFKNIERRRAISDRKHEAITESFRAEKAGTARFLNVF